MTDVLVNGADHVYLDRGAGLELTPVRFPDEEAVRRLAQRLAERGTTLALDNLDQLVAQIDRALGADDKALAEHLRSVGLLVRPLSSYCLDRRDLKGLVIGYGYALLNEIAQFGPIMAKVVCGVIGNTM